MLRFFQSCFGQASAEERQPLAPQTPTKNNKAANRLSVSSDRMPITPSPQKKNPNIFNFSSGSVETVNVNDKFGTRIPDDLDDLLSDDSEKTNSTGSHDDDSDLYASVNKSL